MRESSLPVALHSAILIHARSSLQMVWLIPARSSQSKFQETIVLLRHSQSAKRIASVKVVFEGQETLKKKIKNSACIEKGDVISYELQGRLGLRRVALVPRSAERKTDA